MAGPRTATAGSAASATDSFSRLQPLSCSDVEMDLRRCLGEIPEKCRTEPAFLIRCRMAVPEAAAVGPLTRQHVTRAGERIGAKDRLQGSRVTDDRFDDLGNTGDERLFHETGCGIIEDPDSGVVIRVYDHECICGI